MNLELLKFKYDNFKKFELKFSGIKIGLEILRTLNSQKENIKINTKKSNNEKIKYYDFCDNIIYECCSSVINEKINVLYKEHYINNKVIMHNKLFIICRFMLEKILVTMNFNIN